MVGHQFMQPITSGKQHQGGVADALAATLRYVQTVPACQKPWIDVCSNRRPALERI
jgi:hypothetical protein